MNSKSIKLLAAQQGRSVEKQTLDRFVVTWVSRKWSDLASDVFTSVCTTNNGQNQSVVGGFQQNVNMINHGNADQDWLDGDLGDNIWEGLGRFSWGGVSNFKFNFSISIILLIIWKVLIYWLLIIFSAIYISLTPILETLLERGLVVRGRRLTRQFLDEWRWAVRLIGLVPPPSKI